MFVSDFRVKDAALYLKIIVRLIYQQDEWKLGFIVVCHVFACCHFEFDNFVNEKYYEIIIRFEFNDESFYFFVSDLSVQLDTRAGM